MAKRLGAEYWQRQLEGWHRSDLTQKEYCAVHGLSEKTFYRWRAKEKRSRAAGKSPLTLVPVSVSTQDKGGVVRLRSPGGWSVEVPAGDSPWLANLLRQLP